LGTIGKIQKGNTPTTAPPSATVQEAVEAMARDKRGACAVMDGDALKGLFTERDLMMRVVLKKLDPTKVKVVEVCTTKLITAPPDQHESKALRTMVEQHIRHLPLVDASGKFHGMLSLRMLLQHRVDELTDQLESLTAYMTADGPGG
jgi:CBS domain-containing protein